MRNRRQLINVKLAEDLVLKMLTRTIFIDVFQDTFIMSGEEKISIIGQ